VHAVAGEEDFDEVIRRTAFNILIGNGDAHLKNWSLTYADGVHARLPPAYDLGDLADRHPRPGAHRDTSRARRALAPAGRGRVK